MCKLTLAQVVRIAERLFCGLIALHFFLGTGARALGYREKSTGFDEKIIALPGNATEQQKEFLPVFVFSRKTCMPGAAVDEYGRVNQGLKSGFSTNSQCEHPTNANIYVMTFEDHGAVVYDYVLYFPKDGPAPWNVGGHRHDWEHIMVWTKDQRVTSVTFFQHRGWYTLPRSKLKMKNEHPIVYVGKVKHGMYHSPNRGPGGLFEGVCYFCDTRDKRGMHWLAPHALVDVAKKSRIIRAALVRGPWGKSVSPLGSDNLKNQTQRIAKGEHCHDFGCRCSIRRARCPSLP